MSLFLPTILLSLLVTTSVNTGAIAVYTFCKYV